jgi:hypothetical protein
MSDKSDSLSPIGAAEALGVRPEWIYNLIWRNKIAANKDESGRWQIPTAAVEARRRLSEARRAAEQAGR